MPTPRRHPNRAEQQAADRQRLRQARTQELLHKGLPPVPPVPTMPRRRRWDAAAQQALRLMQTIRNEMQDYYDERSDEWQESQRGEEFTERLQAVEDLVAAIEDLAE